MSFDYHGADGWIKQAARNVQTFRSGLCRIQLEYISRSSSAKYSNFRVGGILAEEDSMPCIDGAFIFPEPSYTDMGNGFIKCAVTAYGRVNTSGVVDTGKRLGSYISYFIETFVSNGTNVAPEPIKYERSDQKLFDFAIYRFICRQSEFPIASDIPELFIYDLDGTIIQDKQTVITTETIHSGKKIGTIIYNGELIKVARLGRQMMTYEITNYGFFNEVIISVDAVGRSDTDIRWTAIPQT